MEKKYRILDVCQELDEQSMNMLTDVAEVRRATGFTPDILIEESRDVDAIIVYMQGMIDKQIFEQAPNLKVVGRLGSGNNNVDLDEATKRGIPVTWSGPESSNTVADLTFGLLLAVGRNISWADRAFKASQDTNWEYSKGMGYVGVDIWEKTIGIIGYGRIGSRVAKRAQGFDMRILVHDPLVQQSDDMQHGIEWVNLKTLLTESDFITIHAPRTEETTNLVGRNELGMMKDGAYIINAAFGGLIDEEALYDSLVSGKIAGAAIDVPTVAIGECTFNPQKPLYRLDNVVMTPTLGVRTAECPLRMAQTMVDGVVKVLQGKQPKWVHNPQVYA